MVKTVFAVTLALVAAATACEQRCFVNQAQSGGPQCVYTCYADNARNAGENAADFAGALAQRGAGYESCYANAGVVYCNKTPQFGACGSHSWKTGRGC